jgi:hypothetical protein
MTAIQYIEKFNDTTDSVSYAFGLNRGTISRTQNLRVPLASAIGADYAHDFSGYGMAARDPETFGLAWIITKATAALVDAEIDSCRSKLLTIGKGKLYALFADGTRRWCYARPQSMPSFSRTVDQLNYTMATATFMRLSNWKASSQTTASQNCSTFETIISISNSGNVPVRDAVFTFTALAAQGWVNLTMQNLTTGEVVATTISADTDTSIMTIDGDRQGVFYSHDSGFFVGGGAVGDAGIGPGAVLADAYSQITRGPMQNGLISLNPGANSIHLFSGGTPNYSFGYAFNAQYA